MKKLFSILMMMAVATASHAHGVLTTKPPGNSVIRLVKTLFSPLWENEPHFFLLDVLFWSQTHGSLGAGPEGY